MRKAAVKIAGGHDKTIRVGVGDIESYLGKPVFSREKPIGGVGVVTGLAWTPMGGAFISIEATRVHTKNRGFKLTGHDVVDLAKKFEEYGVEAIIYTDIGRDGMMTGVNVDATFRLAQQLKTPVIASGGLNGLKDVELVCERLVPEGIIGVIAGRALYEGKIDLKKAQAAANKALGKE